MPKDDKTEKMLIHLRKSKSKFCQFDFTFATQLNQCKTFLSYVHAVSAECKAATWQWSLRSQIL